jgi:hypothetical protein
VPPLAGGIIEIPSDVAALLPAVETDLDGKNVTSDTLK